MRGLKLIKQFDRNYSIVAINHAKLKEFKYCVLKYSGDIHQLLSDELIADNKILSYLRENSSGEFDFLRENLKDKLSKLKELVNTSKTGYGKNDGIYMNFLAYEALKESYAVEPLYLLQRSDVENPKFGVDSVFYVDKTVWIFEFKTSTTKLTEKATAKKVAEGVDSLFCKGNTKIASLYDCKTNISAKSLPKELSTIINELIDNRADTSKILTIDGLHFNICIVSPSDTFDNDELKKYIAQKYLNCKECEAEKKICQKYKCIKYREIKIDNVFHLQLPVDFSLEKLYDSLILKIGESENA